MRSLVLEGTRRLAWHEVPDPQRRHEREAIVRPLAVATCDLDQPARRHSSSRSTLAMNAWPRSSRDRNDSLPATGLLSRSKSPAVRVSAAVAA